MTVVEFYKKLAIRVVGNFFKANTKERTQLLQKLVGDYVSISFEICLKHKKNEYIPELRKKLSVLRIPETNVTILETEVSKVTS